jgi:hypothetical protein
VWVHCVGFTALAASVLAYLSVSLALAIQDAVLDLHCVLQVAYGSQPRIDLATELDIPALLLHAESRLGHKDAAGQGHKDLPFPQR